MAALSVMMMMIVGMMRTVALPSPSIQSVGTEEYRLVAKAMKSLVSLVPEYQTRAGDSQLNVCEGEKLNLAAKLSAEIKRKVHNLPGIRKQ
jgi:hypothetical protein